MNFPKKAVAVAVTTLIGGVAGSAQAADIENMTIQDVTGDGIAGGFAFAPPASTAYTNFFDSTSNVTVFTASGTVSATVTPSNTMGITADGIGESVSNFSAGFLFSSAPFRPVSLNGIGVSRDATLPDGIDGTVNTSDTDLTMSEFWWGGQFGQQLFNLTPGGTAGGTGDGAGNDFTSNIAFQGEAACSTGSSNVCYQLQWESFIIPQGGFLGDTIWQLEGVAKLDGAVTLADGPSAIPVPAAVWLFGSGLLGLVGVARRKNKA